MDPPQSAVAPKVGCEKDITGTAKIPSGEHLWVLAHRIDYEGVWVAQTEGKIDPKTTKWKAHVQFGEKRDIGRDFEIAVITVNETDHISLENYRREAMKSGDWKPIDMPPTTSAPVIRKVTKVSHACN